VSRTWQELFVTGEDAPPLAQDDVLAVRLVLIRVIV
jgi:hypothetical protein